MEESDYCSFHAKVFLRVCVHFFSSCLVFYVPSHSIKPKLSAGRLTLWTLRCTRCAMCWSSWGDPFRSPRPAPLDPGPLHPHTAPSCNAPPPSPWCVPLASLPGGWHVSCLPWLPISWVTLPFWWSTTSGYFLKKGVSRGINFPRDFIVQSCLTESLAEERILG